MYAGDELEVTGTVAELSDAARSATIRVEIRNQRREKVVRGKILAGFLQEGEAAT